MPEPLTTSTRSFIDIISSITTENLFAGGDTGVIIGAFSGSIIYILSATNLPTSQRLMSFLASFLIGGQAAGFVTDAINYITPEVIYAQRPLGAIVASATAVRIFIYISKQSANPAQWLKKLRGHKR